MARTLPGQQTPAVSLESAIAQFLADRELRGLGPRTIEWYRHCLAPFARYAVSWNETAADSVPDARAMRRLLRCGLTQSTSQMN